MEDGGVGGGVGWRIVVGGSGIGWRMVMGGGDRMEDGDGGGE